MDSTTNYSIHEEKVQLAFRILYEASEDPLTDLNQFISDVAAILKTGQLTLSNIQEDLKV